MPAEPIPPARLASLQERFVAAISTPLEIDEVGDYRMQTERYDPDLVAALSVDRLAVYNRQYWFRLLTVVQEEYPLLRHLLGVTNLNRLTMRYVERHPSNSPSLRDLTRHLPAFLEQDPFGEDERLCQCALLEYLLIEVFDAAALPPLDATDPAVAATLTTTPLRLQPHLRLFREDWNLVELRRQAVDDPDDELDLHPERSTSWWAFHRSATRTALEPLGPLQYELLRYLARGLTLETAVEGTAAGLDEEDLAFLEENLQDWFHHWSRLGWFAA